MSHEVNATFTRSAKRARSTRRGEKKIYATCTSPIKHLICPPKFCTTFVFHFSWVLQPSQEKLKTMLMQNFGGQIRCIMGDVQVAYKALFFSSPRLAIRARPTLRAKCRVRLAWLIKRLLCRPCLRMKQTKIDTLLMTQTSNSQLAQTEVHSQNT